MKTDYQTFSNINEPMYILEERKLRRNLQLIGGVAHEADIEIILAFKAYALWKTFPIFREYIGSTTASSLYEARLGYEEFGAPVHTFSPPSPTEKSMSWPVSHHISRSTPCRNTNVCISEPTKPTGA